MENINNVISVKLRKLSSFLHNACEEFENVATEIKEKNIKMSVRSVAVETRQYIHELNAQLKVLSIKIANRPPTLTDNTVLLSHDRKKNIITDKKIISLCCGTEKYFEKAYQSVLKEYFPHQSLRDMLAYQLNGIRSAFMQLNLLRSVRWH
jgi:hypothetical protein